ncbi:MAG: glycosyltransferase family 2 protein [Nanoarchaeota archaeon]|mgnify:CR=1 FL=1
MDSIDILIIHLNGEEVIANCLKSIFKDDKKAKIKILFNQTTDNSVKLVKKNWPNVEIYESKERLGFAESCNYLIKKSTSKYAIFLNNDTIVGKGWKFELLKTIKRHKNCIAVQSKIKSYYKKEYFENAGAAGGFIDKYGYPFCRGRIFQTVEKDNGQYDDEIRVFWGCGVSLLVERKEFIRLGGFDESFFMYAEELDFCWRANNSGKEIWYSPQSIIYHIGSFSVNNEKINFKKEYLISKNHIICLIKNTTGGRRLYLLAWKLGLEIISLMRFPIKRGLPFLMSIPSIIYYLFFSKKEHLNRETIKRNAYLIYPRSIALDHFIRDKKTFKALDFA